MGQGNSRAGETPATSATSSHPASDAAELLQIVQQRTVARKAFEEARGEHVPDRGDTGGIIFKRPKMTKEAVVAARHAKQSKAIAKQGKITAKQHIPKKKWIGFATELAGTVVSTLYGGTSVYLAYRSSRLRPNALTFLKRIISVSQREGVLQLQSAHRERGYVPAIPERSREEVSQALSSGVSAVYAATWLSELENCCCAVDRLCEALKQSEPESTEFTKLSIVLAFVKAYFLLAFAIPGMACGKQYLILRVCSGDVNLLCAELMTWSVDALKNIPTNVSASGHRSLVAPALSEEEKKHLLSLRRSRDRAARKRARVSSDGC